ncbi:MAG: hypothetical protein ACR5LD_01690 [Symbiopectobacterium sp.]
MCYQVRAVAINLTTARELWLTEGEFRTMRSAPHAVAGLLAHVRHNTYWLVDGACGKTSAGFSISTGLHAMLNAGEEQLVLNNGIPLGSLDGAYLN